MAQVPDSTLVSTLQDAIDDEIDAHLNGAGFWTAYTPAVANIYATATGRYSRIGKTVTAQVILTSAAASGGVAIGQITIGTPSTMVTSPQILGSGMGTQAGGNTPCVVWAATTNVVAFYSTKTGIDFGVSSPAAWATGNKIYATFTYEEA